MPLVSTGGLITGAVRRGTGLAAFNVITLEHAEAIAAGALAAGAPAVLQVSENAVRFREGRPGPLAAACARLAEESDAELALHLDHVTDPELLRAAPRLGFSSAMFDASRLDYVGNVKATARAVAFCHGEGLWAEAELGAVGGKAGDAHTPGVRTDPAEAAAYTAATGVDALAVAVGSSHAMTERTATLDHQLIARLRESVPVPLVLHGSSGVPDAELRRAVAAGVVKVNVGTALNSAYTAAVREHLAAHPDGVDPRGALTAARAAMAGTVARFLAVIAAPAD